MRRALALALFFLSCAVLHPTPSGQQQTTHADLRAFRWLDEQHDLDKLTELRRAFAEELAHLRADSGGAHGKPQPTKWVRAGVYDSIAVVFTEGAERVGENAHFVLLAYRYDFLTKSKTRLEGQRHFWGGRIERLAHFASGDPVSDVVFTYHDCVECESVILLAALRFVASEKSWRLREWPGGKSGAMADGIAVGSDAQHGEHLERFDCLHAVRDADGDGLDEVIVRCRVRVVEYLNQEKVRALTDTTTVYQVRNGTATNRTVQNPQERERLNSILCEGKQAHALCKPAR